VTSTSDSVARGAGVASRARPSGHHLILGGCGFLGRHVAALLTRDDQKVVIADRAPPPKSLMAELGERASWVNLDFGGADWDSLLRGAGVVHHYAWGSVPGTANDPSEDFTTNVQPTLRLLEALRQVAVRREAPSLIFPSSGGTVYGKVRNVPTREDHPLAPINVYGAGKASAELYLGVYRAIHGLDCRVARLSNPFGAGQDLSRGQGAATTFVYQALSDQPIHIWGDGEVVRDYIHVSDAAAGLVALACAPRNDRCWIFNMGSGEGVSLNGIVAELEGHLNKTLEVLREPGRQIDIPISVLDNGLARNNLGWSPKLSFSDGISRTLTDLKHHAVLSDLT